jgi:alpha-beta hydrolase superfamily lysophospholipase
MVGHAAIDETAASASVPAPKEGAGAPKRKPPTPEPAQRRLRMGDGIEIAVHDVEPGGAGQPMAQAVFMHGTAMQSRFYFALTRLLAARGLRVALVDQRGHGASGGEPGQVAHPMQYADDIADCLRTQARLHPQLPLFVLAHSGGCSIMLKALPRLDVELAGLALLMPTFAHDAAMVRRQGTSSPTTLRLRHGVVPRAARHVADDGKEPMRFRLPAFLLARLLRVGRRRPALICDDPDPARPAYVYSCDAAAASMIDDTEAALAHLRCPLLLATGEQDYWVNDAALHGTLPWMVPARVPFTSFSYAGANHYTALYQAVKDLDAWIRGAVAAPQMGRA